MDPQFQRCVDFVIDHLEGGDKVVTDSGGVTKFGISAKAHPDLAIASLTRSEAIGIYESEYWLPSGAERIDWPMSLVVFDAAVNQGVAFAQTIAASSLDHLEALWERLLRYVDIANRNAPERGNLRGWCNRLVAVYNESVRG